MPLTSARHISPAQAATTRAELAQRLRARRTEVEEVILTRIQRLSEPVGIDDGAYLAGLRIAVAKAVDYGLDSVEKGGEGFVAVPQENAQQARRAAREGVGLGTVMRRYALGNKALEEFIMAEAEGVPDPVLHQILSDQGPQVDRLMEAVEAEYRDELEHAQRSVRRRESDRIANLLESNVLVAPGDIEYAFDRWHIGLIFVGAAVEEASRTFAARLGQPIMTAVRDSEIAWAWIGSPQPAAPARLEQALGEALPGDTSLAVGEWRWGLAGWRQTHHEARMALRVMLYRRKAVTRCRDVILDAAVIKDQWMATSLVETYLTPLEGRGDFGERLRQTLRAYYSADQNAASAAEALGVARHTVERRLRKAEEKLGRTLSECSAELQVALRVYELVSSTRQPDAVFGT